MKLSLPLSVQVSKRKTFILNLNNYRNAHFQVLNKAKKMYIEEVISAFPDKKFLVASQKQILFRKVELTYTLYQPTSRRVDISNPLSIIDKFTCDALVELGVLPDDASDNIPKVTYQWGGIDRENPRCEVEIREL